MTSRAFLLVLLLAACHSNGAPAIEGAPTVAATGTSPDTRKDATSPGVGLLGSRATSAPREDASSSALPGSERNGRVAIDRKAVARKLVYFAADMDEAERQELTRVAPGIVVVNGLTAATALARAAEADGADARFASAEFLRAAKNLAWLQARSVGIERYLALPDLRTNERIVLTNGRSTSGPSIADHAFALLLTLTRDIEVHLRGRDSGAWNQEGSGDLVPIAFQDRTLLVLGLGGIGTEIARRGYGFGMHVIAMRRSDDPAPSFVEHVGKPSELHALLAHADVVAVALPLTDETKNLIDAAAFAAMKPGSYLVNVARGKVVVTEALVDALRSKKLAGAALDVTDPEPLPPEHPLWKMPNVVITPHVAASAELTDDRLRALVRENLRRFDRGEPLLNVVDKQAGY